MTKIVMAGGFKQIDEQVAVPEIDAHACQIFAAVRFNAFAFDPLGGSTNFRE